MPGKREGGSQRKTRVEHGIRDTLTELIASDVKDPRVHAPKLLTISKVELNVDMSVARCYVSVVDEDAVADAALEGLKKAAGFLRGPIGRRLALQHAPELRTRHRDQPIPVRQLDRTQDRQPHRAPHDG